jgi:hypothetical protein
VLFMPKENGTFNINNRNHARMSVLYRQLVQGASIGDGLTDLDSGFGKAVMSVRDELEKTISETKKGRVVFGQVVENFVKQGPMGQANKRKRFENRPKPTRLRSETAADFPSAIEIILPVNKLVSIEKRELQEVAG